MADKSLKMCLLFDSTFLLLGFDHKEVIKNVHSVIAGIFSHIGMLSSLVRNIYKLTFGRNVAYFFTCDNRNYFS